VHFFASLVPPAQQILIQSLGSTFAGARLNTGCPPSTMAVSDLVQGTADEGIDFPAVSPDGWTFISISRSNSSASKVTVGAANLNQASYPALLDFCPLDPRSLFRAIEFNYPMLVSPIMMTATVFPLSKLQEIYYNMFQELTIRNGPLPPDSSLLASIEAARRRKVTVGKASSSKGGSTVARTNRLSTAPVIPVSKDQYIQRSALVVPPILFQQRSTATVLCPTSYSREWIMFQYQSALNTSCSGPFVCPDFVWESPESVFACPGESVKNGTFFGVELSEFQGVSGFAELLYSLTENSKLFRDNDLKRTEDFIDGMTKSVALLFVFFTPQYGVTTVMTITADFSNPVPALIGIKVDHYEILEGFRLHVFITVQIILFVCVGLMLLDAIPEFRQLMWYLIGKDKETGKNLGHNCFVLAADVLTVIMIISAGVFRLQMRLGSASQTNQIVGNLTAIPWYSEDIVLTEKKNQFFKIVQELLSLIAQENWMDRFTYVVLMINLFRVIMCTSLHPRLALLTGTISAAFDDLWHTGILTVLLMVCFGLIGKWRFGADKLVFSTLENSLQTGFNLMFTATPFDGWNQVAILFSSSQFCLYDAL
jgi:hypothetical protein